MMDTFLTPDHEMNFDEDRANIERGLKSFYYDTALSSTDPVLTLLDSIVGTDRVMFGSDYPQVPDNLVRATADSAYGSAALGANDREKIQRGNALRLFPRLAKPNDRLQA